MKVTSVRFTKPLMFGSGMKSEEIISEKSHRGVKMTARPDGLLLEYLAIRVLISPAAILFMHVVDDDNK